MEEGDRTLVGETPCQQIALDVAIPWITDVPVLRTAPAAGIMPDVRTHQVILNMMK